MTEEDERFQLAARSARRLIAQCVAHVERVTPKLGDRAAAAAASTPHGIDTERVLRGEHRVAFKALIELVEAKTNALVTLLAGLKLLLGNDTFLPLPAFAVTRSVAEVAANCAWLIHPGLTSDQRAARSYAATIYAAQRNLAAALPQDVLAMRSHLDDLIHTLGRPGSGVRLENRMKDGVRLDDIAQVIVVGPTRERARAKVEFNYSQRVRDEIPRAAGLYSTLSAAVHGEHVSVAASWNVPDAFARTIAHVAAESTVSWSRAVHDWVGAQVGPFLNEFDRRNVILSMPKTKRDEFAAKLAGSPERGGPEDFLAR